MGVDGGQTNTTGATDKADEVSAKAGLVDEPDTLTTEEIDTLYEELQADHASISQVLQTDAHVVCCVWCLVSGVSRNVLIVDTD